MSRGTESEVWQSPAYHRHYMRRLWRPSDKAFHLAFAMGLAGVAGPELETALEVGGLSINLACHFGVHTQHCTHRQAWDIDGAFDWRWRGPLKRITIDAE